jgi:acyl-coenzyme A thioesterase PaaI-like protein
MEEDIAKDRSKHIAPGELRLSMSVRQDMSNRHGIYRGGCISGLADSAVALVCKSDNQISVAQQNPITCPVCLQLDALVTRQAGEEARSSRCGTYDVTAHYVKAETFHVSSDLRVRSGGKTCGRFISCLKA